MRELDAVLQSFLERAERTLTPEDISAFERVLDLPDPELYGYLLGRSEPADPRIASFISRIRGLRS